MAPEQKILARVSNSTAFINFLSDKPPVIYLGETTITRCPRLAKAIGNEPQTSPKPPVLEYGAASAVTKTTLWVVLVAAVSIDSISSDSLFPSSTSLSSVSRIFSSLIAEIR